MSEDEHRPEVYLKDASVRVKRLIKTYWQVKLGIDLPISAFEIIFGDETHTWDDFEGYTEIKDTDENASLDAYDREILNIWLWARVQGESFPHMLFDEDMKDFLEKFNNKDLLGKLYKRADVYNAESNRVKLSKDFRITELTLPETLTLSGDVRVVNAALELLTENKQAFLEKITAIGNAK